MIILMLLPLAALACLVAWVFWWEPRRLRLRRREMVRPQQNACAEFFDWHLQQYQKRKR